MKKKTKSSPVFVYRCTNCGTKNNTSVPPFVVERWKKCDWGWQTDATHGGIQP